MPNLGGLAPFPRRLGGGKPRLQSILEGLAAGRGTALDASNPKTIVYAENMSVARALDAAWGTNVRVANVWDPYRCGMEILTRWERILKLQPGPDDYDITRRRRVAEILERFGQAPTMARLAGRLAANLGPAFVALETLSFATATINVPDNTFPFGTTTNDVPYSSNVGKLLVRMQKPAGWSESLFYAAADKVFPTVDPIVSVWTTFDWYRPGPTFSSVAGGPSAAGFYLDTDNNLDNQIFDE